MQAEIESNAKTPPTTNRRRRVKATSIARTVTPAGPLACFPTEESLSQSTRLLTSSDGQRGAVRCAHPVLARYCGASTRALSVPTPVGADTGLRKPRAMWYPRACVDHKRL